MENTSYKKTIGTGFLILFGIFFLNLGVNIFTAGSGSTLLNIRQLWYCITPFIMGAAVVIIAFPRKSQTNYLCKTGAIIYLAMLTIMLINNISSLTINRMLISFPAGYQYVPSLVLYLPGLIFLIWGCKLWMPVKIIATLRVVIAVAVDIIISMQSTLYEKYSDDLHEKLKSYDTIYEILGAASIILTLAAIVFIIIWMCRKQVPAEIQK